MRSRNIGIIINTRQPAEHDIPYGAQAWAAIEQLQEMRIGVFYTGGHHRKLAIFDRKVLWEGSLNILSRYDSCEVMRRIESSELAEQMIKFVRLDRF